MSEDYYNSSDNSRDGYRSRRESNGNQNGSYGRPRMNRPAGSSVYGSRNYGSNDGYRHFNGESGYQQRSQGDYASRQERGGNEGGYQRYENHSNASGYGQRRESGYQPRENRYGKSRFGQQGNSNYQNRPMMGGYRTFQQRSNEGADSSGYETEGGYHPRRQGGYQNRSGQGNYQNRIGGQQHGGYGQRSSQQRRSGYNPHAKYSQKKRLEYKEENYDPTVPLRLNKFLANAGVCSRRDADKYIEAGVVTVNGQVVTELGTKILRTDEVKFHDNPIKMEKKVYVLLNKPKGYVTTSEDPQNRKTVMNLVQNACPERIYPVGRLDRNTTGVLLLTNDGELASKLTHPKFLKKKIYHVTTDQNVSAADIQRIAEGITLEDGEIKADAVEYAHDTDKKQVGIEIHSGKNRIVRRIFESLGYHVVKLDRVYFAGLTKKNVRRGDWRYLTEKEVQMLRMGAFE